MRSLEELGSWGVADYPTFRASREASSVTAYGRYVTKVLRAECERQWAASTALRIDPVPYSPYAHAPPAGMRALAKASGGWPPMAHARGWCSLRAQVVPLAQRDGRPHWGRDGACIFCGRAAPAIYHHVLGTCEAWRADRKKVTALGGLQGALGQLGAAAMEMASAIDSRARKWWREQGGFHG